LRRAAFCLRPQLRDVDFVHIKQAVDIAVNGSTGAIAILPHGLQLTLDYQDLRLFTADAAWSVPDWPLLWRDEPVPVAIPGRTELPAGPLPASRAAMHDSPHWSLETQFWSTGGHDIMNNPDRWTAYLDADRLGTSLALRRREPGDRFQPLGMDGRNVEVADFMINAKIPRRWRGHLPLLVHRRPGSAGKEEIAWMAGWRIDERVKISPATHRVVRLRWQRIQRSKA
jgi:tRNA(Ile)-lysidine synthase